MEKESKGKREAYMALHDIMFLGDVHGKMRVVATAMENAARMGIDTILQVGDFWLYEDADLEKLERVAARVGTQFGTTPTIHFIDGNHEDYRIINPHGVTTHMSDHLIYHPRGDVFMVHDTVIGCFGGAMSIDKQWRTPGKTWFEAEIPTHEDVHRAMRVFHRGVDVLITHEIPQFALPQVGHTVPDESTLPHTEYVRYLVDDVLEVSKAPVLVHGHWHYPCVEEYRGITVVSLGKETDYGSMMVVGEDTHRVSAVTKEGIVPWLNSDAGNSSF